ncbi:MAG: Fic family protein, partial [Hyphomonadaceae bacterium]
PTVRRTQKLIRHMEAAFDQEAAALTRNADPDLLRRAVSFLYTKETKSTWEIEGEEVSGGREEKFVAALTRAAQFDTADKAALIGLQNAIVDPRYSAGDWRDMQNYVGETISGYRERVHFVCPKPEDVASLMASWGATSKRVLDDKVDPVVAAALAAFGFVFIHPFEDGNGRIHRFLVHNVLAKTGFSPPGVIFPVSVSIVRDMPAYDAALESFSKPLLSLIDWEFLEDEHRVIVRGDTADHYRYFDATRLAEYLYDRVAETVRKDLAEELDFLGCFDRAYKGVRAVVDMPNKKVSLFVRLALQNSGRLPKTRRKLFEEVTDAEIAAMEAAVQQAQAPIDADDAETQSTSRRGTRDGSHD